MIPTKARIKFQVSARGATVNRWFKAGEVVEIVDEMPNRMVLVHTQDNENCILPIDSLEILKDK